MMGIQHTIVIDRPVEEVFEFVSDASNDRLWETGVEACVPDGEAKLGQQRDVTMVTFGRRYQGEAEVTDFEQDQRLTIEIKSGLPVKGESDFQFDSVNGSTELTYSMRAKPVNRIFSVIQPVMGWMLQRQWENDLLTLKKLLESEEVRE
jgi:uncharacterized protein YndB with AHSA1/START domain